MPDLELNKEKCIGKLSYDFIIADKQFYDAQWTRSMS